MSLAAASVHCDDDIAFHTLVEHFLLVGAELNSLALGSALLISHCVARGCISVIPCLSVSCCCGAGLVEG
jgi:hypothetical protein